MSVAFAPGDVVQVRLNYGSAQDNTNFAFNVLHYQVANSTGPLPSTNAILAEIAEAASDMWADAWSGGASNEVAMLGVSCQNIFPEPRSRNVTFNITPPVGGEVASQSLPLQDAPTILKVTDYGERWGIGRMFYVGVPESMANLGLVIPGVTRDAMILMRDRVALPLNAVGGNWSMALNPVLYHPATPAKDGKPATETRITRITSGLVYDWIIKSMKTRRPGKGI